MVKRALALPTIIMVLLNAFYVLTLGVRASSDGLAREPEVDNAVLIRLFPYGHWIPEIDGLGRGENAEHIRLRYVGIEQVEPKVKPLSQSPGDWIVIGEEVRRDEVIVLTGNLIIEPGGSLTFINVTLYMNCTHDGEWQIIVKPRGIFNVLSGSIITAYNPEYEFLFYVHGRLAMRDSKLHECGYHWDYPGLYVYSGEGVTIENCTISHNYYGIYCYRSSNVLISGCEISYNNNGICCFSSVNIFISGCCINYNSYGIHCEDSSNVFISRCAMNRNKGSGVFCRRSFNISISGCVMSHNGVGINCWFSSKVFIINNIFIRDGIFLLGDWPGHYVHYIRNNTVNGKPLYYVSNVKNYTVPSDAGQVIVANSRYVMINGVNASYTGVGIQIAFSSDISISECNINNNSLEGISCWHSSKVSISGCEISHNDIGIYCWGSSNISISRCKVSHNDYGIVYKDSSRASTSGCVISHNKWNGVHCLDSSNISISGCVINYNYNCGIYCWTSSNIFISGCAIRYNGGGIFCQYSSNVVVYHCDIAGNKGGGLHNDGPRLVNATYNWWGSPEGPEYRRKGDPYDPEEVYSYDGPEYLIYEPWLTEPAVLPMIKIIFPIEGAKIESYTITIEWEVKPGIFDIVRVEIRLDDGPWIDVTKMTSYTFIRLSEGRHVVTIRVVDEAWNVVEASVNFYVELLGPAIFVAFIGAALAAIIAIVVIVKKKKR